MDDVPYPLGGRQCWAKENWMLKHFIFESFPTRGSMALMDANSIRALISEDVRYAEVYSFYIRRDATCSFKEPCLEEMQLVASKNLVYTILVIVLCLETMKSLRTLVSKKVTAQERVWTWILWVGIPWFADVTGEHGLLSEDEGFGFDFDGSLLMLAHKVFPFLWFNYFKSIFFWVRERKGMGQKECACSLYRAGIQRWPE